MVEFKRVVNHKVQACRFQHRGKVALQGNLLDCPKAWVNWAELAGITANVALGYFLICFTDEPARCS
jgi:hypothetical protein